MGFSPLAQVHFLKESFDSFLRDFRGVWTFFLGNPQIFKVNTHTHTLTWTKLDTHGVIMQTLFHLYDSTQQLSKDRTRRKPNKQPVSTKITMDVILQVHMTDQVMLPLPRHSFVALGLPSKAHCPCIKGTSSISLEKFHTHTRTDDPTRIPIADGFGRKQPGQNFERSCEVPAGAWLEGKFPWKDATPSRNKWGAKWVGTTGFFLIFGCTLFCLAEGTIWKHKPWYGDLSNQICDLKMIWEVIRPTTVDQGHTLVINWNHFWRCTVYSKFYRWSSDFCGCDF